MQYSPIILLIGIPIAAGVLSLFLSDRLKILIRALALLTTLATLVLSVSVFIQKTIYWPAEGYHIFAADNLSSFIGIALSLFAFLITVYSFGYVKKEFGRYFGYILLTLGSSFGAVFANDLIVLLIFWGFLGITFYLLINTKGTDKASAAAKKMLIIIGGTDALMILGIGLLWAASGTLAMDKIRVPINNASAIIAYLSIVIAAFAKAGAMPFHSWLPDVAEDGPTPVTAYLPASLDKLIGIYLLARASMNLFAASGNANMVLLVVGSATIVLAVTFALVQHDLKRLLGYHAISQVGYMVLGIGTGNPIGIAGGLFHMLNNAIYKSCLFLAGGAVEKRTGTTDLSKLGGLVRYMPITFAGFLIASLSISGIPPFNGFVSKWMIYQGIIELGKDKNSLWVVWLVCAMFGSALTLASFMKLLHAVFLGRASKNIKDIKEVGFSMSFPIVVLAGLCIIFGVFAFTLPIPLFIAPALGKSALTFIGTWNPVLASTFILIAIFLGLVFYFVTRKAGFRTVKPFVGGEDQDDLDRVSGVEFYNTISDMKGLKGLYKKEKDHSLDIYDQGKAGTAFLTGILQRLHNGVLPTYLVWCILGMTVMFFVLFFR